MYVEWTHSGAEWWNPFLIENQKDGKLPTTSADVMGFDTSSKAEVFDGWNRYLNIRSRNEAIERSFSSFEVVIFTDDGTLIGTISCQSKTDQEGIVNGINFLCGPVEAKWQKLIIPVSRADVFSARVISNQSVPQTDVTVEFTVPPPGYLFQEFPQNFCMVCHTMFPLLFATYL